MIGICARLGVRRALLDHPEALLDHPLGAQDKLGPICRSVADCAVIFDVLRGQDDADPTSRNADLLDPFAVDISILTVGYLPGVERSAPEVKTLRPNHRNS